MSLDPGTVQGLRNYYSGAVPSAQQFRPIVATRDFFDCPFGRGTLVKHKAAPAALSPLNAISAQDGVTALSDFDPHPDWLAVHLSIEIRGYGPYNEDCSSSTAGHGAPTVNLPDFGLNGTIYDLVDSGIGDSVFFTELWVGPPPAGTFVPPAEGSGLPGKYLNPTHYDGDPTDPASELLWTYDDLAEWSAEVNVDGNFGYLIGTSRAILSVWAYMVEEITPPPPDGTGLVGMGDVRRGVVREEI